MAAGFLTAGFLTEFVTCRSLFNRGRRVAGRGIVFLSRYFCPLKRRSSPLQNRGPQRRKQRTQMRLFHLSSAGDYDHTFASSTDRDVHQTLPFVNWPRHVSRVDRIKNNDLGLGALLAVDGRSLPGIRFPSVQQCRNGIGLSFEWRYEQAVGIFERIVFEKFL